MRKEVLGLRARLTSAKEFIDFQQERRLELAQMLKVGFWEWDEIRQKPISYSPEMADVLGVDQQRLQKLFHNPDEFRNILHPDDRQYYRDNVDSRAILKPGESRIFEYRILVKQRQIRHIREYEKGVFGEDDNLVSSFGMVQDITDGQLAVDALKESERRYHMLFEQLPLGVQEEDYTAVKKVIDKLLFQGVDIEEYFLDNQRVLYDLVTQTRITNVTGRWCACTRPVASKSFLLARKTSTTGGIRNGSNITRVNSPFWPATIKFSLLNASIHRWMAATSKPAQS